MGGNAFENTSPIKREHIQYTLFDLGRDLSNLKNCNLGDLTKLMLGSAGKKPISGDIDLNIDNTKYHIGKVETALRQLLGAKNVKYKPGTNQIFTSVHVPSTGERVQVDFMFGKKDWQEFSYFSSPESAYKGLYRTELLKAITAYTSDYTSFENGELIARVGPTFFHDRGCIWRNRYRPFRKVGDKTKRVLAFKEVDTDEFDKEFPDCKILTTPFTIDTPGTFCFYFMGDSVKPSEVETYEGIRDLVLKDPVRFDKDVLFKIYEERLLSLKQPIPDEIKNDFK